MTASAPSVIAPKHRLYTAWFLKYAGIVATVDKLIWGMRKPWMTVLMGQTMLDKDDKEMELVLTPTSCRIQLRRRGPKEGLPRSCVQTAESISYLRCARCYLYLCGLTFHTRTE